MGAKDDDKYKVGYKNPPRGSQFKKEQSGNKSGKPAEPKYSSPIDQILAQKFDAIINGKKRKLNTAQLIALRMIERAAAGKAQDVRLFYSMADKSIVFRGLVEAFEKKKDNVMTFVYRTHDAEPVARTLGITAMYRDRPLVKTWAVVEALRRWPSRQMQVRDVETIKLNCEEPGRLEAIFTELGFEIIPDDPNRPPFIDLELSDE